MAVAAGNVLIPGDLTDSQRQEIEKHLQSVLAELRNHGAQRVTSRLNYSNTEKVSPAWAGTVEDDEDPTPASRLRCGQNPVWPKQQI